MPSQSRYAERVYYRAVRRAVLLALTIAVALTSTGCGPDFCRERSLVGFLFCDPKFVSEPEPPVAQIDFSRDRGPEGSPTMWVGGTYTVRSIDANVANADNPLYPENLVTREQWDVDGLPGYELDYPYGGTSVTRKIDEPTQRTLRLRVTGPEGRYRDASIFLIVTPFSETPGPRPLLVRLNVNENPIGVGRQAAFFAEVNQNDPPTQVEWDVDGVPGYEVSGTDLRITRTYGTPGQIPIWVRVRDANGAVDEDSILLDVRGGEPPVADLQVTPNPARPGQEIVFDASDSRATEGSTIMSYEWDLDEVDGDFEVVTGTRSTYVGGYEEAFTTPDGGRTVRVRVTDNSGRQSIAETKLYVVNGESVEPAHRAAAAAATTTLLSARLDLRKLVSAGRTAGGSSLRGVRVRGKINGRLLDAQRRPTTVGPPILRKLLRGTWDARLNLKRPAKGSTRHSVSGLGIVSTGGRRPARACVRLTVRSQAARPGQPPLVGSFKVLGGERGAERLRASARFGLVIRDRGYSLASGRITSATGSKRRMPAGCRSLLRAAR